MLKIFQSIMGIIMNMSIIKEIKLKEGLAGLEPNDIVLLSDADEIPNLKNKKFLDFDSAVFLQNMYYYTSSIFTFIKD